MVYSQFGIQIIVQLKTLEKTLTYIVWQIWLFDRCMNKIDRPPGGIQNHAAIVTSRQVFFKLLTELRGQLAIDILGQGTQQTFTIRMEMIVHFILAPHG
jgi:hypothetical protein